MSNEYAPLTVEEENSNTEQFDVALILRNFDTENDAGEVTAAKCYKIFRRVFKLDENLEKNEVIDRIEESWINFKLTINSESTTVNKLYPFIVDKVKLMISEYLMMEVEDKFSVDNDEIHICLKALEENLMVQADLDEYLLQFKRNPEETLDFQEIPPFAAFEKHDPNKFIGDQSYKDYFKNYDFNDKEVTKGSLFTSKDRIRLIYSMLCGSLDMGYLSNLGIVLRFMPLSNSKKIEDLQKDWGNFYLLYKNPFKSNDLQRINEYFGEKIGMYFAWLEYLMRLMVPLAVIGLIFAIISFASPEHNDSDDSFTAGEVVAIIFALLLPFFSTIYEQLWIRNQNTLCWKWGTTDLSQVEEQRPEFKGVYKQDPVTGRVKKIQKTSQAIRFRKIISHSIVALFVGLVLAAVIALFLYRATLNPDSWGPTFVGILNAFQIKIFNFIYLYVAKMLNSWENHELPSEYSDNLTIKLFLFQFVNSYTSLFYIAFVKRDVEGCEDDNCIDELTLQLATIFITNLLLNFVEILTPMLMTKYSKYKENKAILEKFGEEKKLSNEEEQAKLGQYDTPLSDYMEVVIAYGYVILFGASFPLTATLFLVLIIVEIRVDAWKLCTVTQRPFPEATNSIGVWLYIIQVMSVVGAITNVGIILFTTNAFDIEDTGDKWIVFIALEHILLFIKVSISLLIPDTPFVVNQANVWSKRVVDERLHGKLADAAKVRVSRNLHFSKSKLE